jgi:hypothetical protein
MFSTARSFAAALLATAALTLPARAAHFVEALPAATPVPVTATSHPWLYYKTTLRPLDLDKAGYVEEEYLIGGNANVYDWDSDPTKDLQVKYKNAPYTTRILVRRPKDQAKFSGNVLVETMNPARPFDMPIMFGWIGPEVLAHGDVWVGVSMGPVMDSLKRFDSGRYATLSFANPAPAAARACAAGGRGGRPASANESENGLRLDALAQIGRWLRGAPGNPLTNVKDVILIGHTGGDVATYASSLGRQARLPGDKPIYDAFLMHSGSNAGALMNCGQTLAAGDPRATPGHLGVPVVIIKTQSDLPFAARPDSDDPKDIFRVYDIPGASHADKFLYTWIPNVAEQRKAVDPAKVTPVTEEWPFDDTCDTADLKMNDFPQGYLVAGILSDLEQYLRDKAPMPHAERIALTGAGRDAKPVLDQYGNATGGVRTPFVDVPTGTYVMPLTGQNATCGRMADHQVWEWGKTLSVYGSYANYAAKVNASVDKLIAGRWVSAEDGEAIRKQLLGGK